MNGVTQARTRPSRRITAGPRRSARRLVAAVLRVAGLAALLTPAQAFGTAPAGMQQDGDFITYEPPAAERRDGFTMGLELELGISQFEGYPNEVAKLGDPAFEADTGPAFGNSFNFWFGGALRDWLSAGVGGSAFSATGADYTGAGGAFLLHVEAFPLWDLGGAFRNLGTSFDGGVGFARIVRVGEALDRTSPAADGGIMSTLSGSVFYEPFRFWHFSSGPSASYTHSFSQSMSTHQVLIGWRLVFYGVQPRPQERRSRRGSSLDTATHL